MKINVLGGGPAGLYLAYLARKRIPGCEVHVHERNAADATFGFGVVLAGRGMAKLEAADVESFERIKAISRMLGHQRIILNGEAIEIEGAEYGGAVERLKLLNVLQTLCEEQGVRISYHDDVTDPTLLEEADLVVGADGANSTLRNAYNEEFGTYSSSLTNAFSWYGAECDGNGPTLSFRTAGKGAFCAHYYPYTDTMCTFVMECDIAAWQSCGFEEKSDDERQAFCEELFQEDLGGRKLISNNSVWRNFEPVGNRNWVHGHRVLIGDAVRRAHFSIGSGTRIAMEDSIALVDAIAECQDIPSALETYVARRKPKADNLLSAARESYTWYEDMAKRMAGKPVHDFALDYLTRTSNMDVARATVEYPGFMAQLDCAKAAS
ncbi:FAD-dependent monooxygenase [Pontivivens nitratireducens]|uniref:FAD-dependent monooxygenase n=1 Tax=Pontivivens nitratireducens TaxID=2758038 RepID=UPI001639887F|nr:FAD-dependent monooxygenase [Pontibrevibacter nitratireducens]